VSARQSLQLAWHHRRFLGICAIACVSVAAVLALTAERTYESRTQFLVSTSSGGRDIGDAYRGELFSQQRVATYAELVSSTEMLQAVARDVGEPGGMQALRGRIQASVTPDTALIDVVATGGSPRQAKAIADAVARHLPRLVDALETPGTGSTSPVRVIATREAELPASPASPDMRLHLALGLLAGLVLGIAGVAMRTAFDDRIWSVEAIERIAGVPVVGSVAEDGEDNGPVVLLDDPLSPRAEDYRRVRTQLHARWGSSTISSLVVSSVGRHNGKTLIAANLAVALAHGGQRVALVDGDPQAATLSRLFDLRAAQGLTDVLAGVVAPDAVLTRLRDLPLAVVGAGTPQRDPTDVLASPRLPAVIAALREHADVVIIDAPPLTHGAEASRIAAVASASLLVTRLDPAAAVELEAAARAIAPAAEPAFGVVVNRRAPRRAWSREAFGRFGGGRAAPTPPRDAGPGADAAARRQVPSGRRA
jgi:succinoglycan biosynthesis transport protein ExoP